jgi:hypothetical protein
MFKKFFEIQPIKQQAEITLYIFFKKMRTANSWCFRKKDADVRLEKNAAMADIHCKKRFAVFPYPDGMSLTKPTGRE